MVKYILAVLLLITIPAEAVCNTVSTDDNTRLKNLAQEQFEQSTVEFKKGNAVRGCQLLKVSRSFIKQTDEKIITEYIVVQYDKLCETKQ
jgi:hypothetical protein